MISQYVLQTFDAVNQWFSNFVGLPSTFLTLHVPAPPSPIIVHSVLMFPAIPFPITPILSLSSASVVCVCGGGGGRVEPPHFGNNCLRWSIRCSFEGYPIGPVVQFHCFSSVPWWSCWSSHSLWMMILLLWIQYILEGVYRAQQVAFLFWWWW